MSNLEVALEEFKLSRHRAAKIITEVFEESIREKLKKAGLSAIMWEQYTPHFNDGDPCTFGVHAVWVAGKPNDADECEFLYCGEEFFDEYRVPAVRSVTRLIWASSEFLQEIYGDGSQVTIWVDNMTHPTSVEEIEHD